MRWANRQPGLAHAKTQIGGAPIPRHRRAAAIAPLGQRVIEITYRIFKLVAAQIRFRQAQFLPLINQRRASHGQQQSQHQLGQRIGCIGPAKAAARAHHIMVGKRDRWPMIRMPRQQGVMIADELRLQPVRVQQRKAVTGMQPLIGRCKAAAAFGFFGKFAHHEAVRITVNRAPYLIQNHNFFGQVTVMIVKLQVRCVRPMVPAALVHWHRRIIGQRCIMQIRIGDIETETIHSALQPGVQNRQRRRAGRGIAPIQLGLLAQEFVVIVLPPRRVIGPCLSCKGRKPIVRHRAVNLWWGPDIPIGLVAAGQRFPKPCVLVRRVRQHLVSQ